jgi:hypothetical protein
MTANVPHDISVIGFVQNAGDMKHAVLKDFDRDLFLLSMTISAGQNYHRDTVMTESRCPLRDYDHRPLANSVLLGLASLEHALLFDFDEAVAQGQMVGEVCRVQTNPRGVQNHHRCELRGLH